MSEVDKHFNAHVTYLDKYYALDKFIASGRKVPRTGGVILVNATNRDELDAILQEDPFCIADAAAYDIIKFVPTMAAKGFEARKYFI